MDAYFEEPQFLTTPEKAKSFMEKTDKEVKEYFIEEYGKIPEEYNGPIWDVNPGDDYVYCDIETPEPESSPYYRGISYNDLIEDIQNGDDSEYLFLMDTEIIENEVL